MYYLVPKALLDKKRAEFTEVLESFEQDVDTDPCILLLGEIERECYSPDRYHEPELPNSWAVSIFLFVVLFWVAIIMLIQGLC